MIKPIASFLLLILMLPVLALWVICGILYAYLYAGFNHGEHFCDWLMESTMRAYTEKIAAQQHRGEQ